jgi:acetyl-CoA carboxylase biotin carboxyl carrier protein
VDDFAALKDLLRAFNQSSFTRYTVTAEGVRISLRQKPRGERAPVKVDPARGNKPASEAKAKAAPEYDPAKVIESQRVGHFYPIRNQRGELGLKEGDSIEDGQAFGLVESMNLKYELRANKAGVMDRYLIEDGEAVEFGQPLILLK